MDLTKLAYLSMQNNNISTISTEREQEKRFHQIYVVHPIGLHPWEGSLLLSPKYIPQAYKRAMPITPI